jgi:beta-galactosidase beta subunit
VVAGAEAMVWAPRASLRLTQPYDVERDAALGHAPAQDLSWLRLRPGLVAVFFGDDAHAGRLAIDAPAAVTKVVVKVATADT